MHAIPPRLETTDAFNNAKGLTKKTRTMMSTKKIIKE